MRLHWKAIVGVLLIFVFGVGTGVLCTLIGIKHRATVLLQRPGALVEILERRTTHNLNLDASQQEKVHECFMANLQQRKVLQSRIQPEVQALNWRMVQQIDAVLRPDQTERFHENIAQFRKRFGKVMPGAEPGETLPPPAVEKAPAQSPAPAH